MPYWRLSSFYFFYFCTVGALMPYWGLYLQSEGFDAVAIGELVAILLGTKIVAPFIWGWIADHHGHRMLIVRLASLASCLSFAAIFWSHSYWSVAAVMLVFGFFWNASLPQFEATTLNHLGDRVSAYTNIRVWGSVGFVLTVVALGWALEYYGVGSFLITVLVLMVAIWLSSEFVPERAAGHLHLEHTPLFTLIRRPPVLALLVCCFLIQAGHGPYYTFYSIFLESAGYSRTTIGLLWALGVVAEVFVFMVMHRLLPRYGCYYLILLSLFLAVIRWIMIGWFIDSLGTLLIAQVLHAATFGIFHAAAIQLIHRYFTGRQQGRGQALYSSMSFGAGGAAGTLFSGYAWETLGPAMTFTGASVFCLLAMIITWRWGEN